MKFNTDADYALDADVLIRAEPDNASVDDLMSALAVYQGELLPGLYDDWVVLEREHLRSVLDRAANLGCILIVQPCGKARRKGVSQAVYLLFFS